MPPSVLSSTFVADSSLHGQAPTPVSRTRMSTRSVGATHSLRMDSGHSSPELHKRPTHARRLIRQDSGRSAVTSSSSGSDDSVRAFFRTPLFRRESALICPRRSSVRRSHHKLGILTHGSPLHFKRPPWPAIHLIHPSPSRHSGPPASHSQRLIQPIPTHNLFTETYITPKFLICILHPPKNTGRHFPLPPRIRPS